MFGFRISFSSNSIVSVFLSAFISGVFSNKGEIINWLLKKIEDYKRKKRFKKKIEELKKRDPFTYNH